MKIAQIVCVFPPDKSGIGNVAYNFSKILNRKDQTVTIFTPDYGQTKQEKYDFEVIFLKPWLKYGHGAFLPQLLFKLSDFDIVYLHYPFFGTAEIVWLAKMLFRKKFKLIIHYHMDVDNSSPLFKILSSPAKMIRTSLFEKAEAVTCASLDYVKNSHIAKIYKKYPAQFKEIPFGVDTGRFYPVSKKENEIKNILFVGGLDKAHYFKGVNILLEAISKLPITNYQLLITGDGDLRPRYIRQAKELGIANKVKFLGKVPDEKLPATYQQADLFVLPSINKNEALGLVLLEAMASGLPVIASDLPGVRTVFQIGQQGLLAQPGNANDLKSKIEEILNNDILRKKMGQEARRLVLEKYSWEEVGKKLNNVIK